MRLVPCLPSGLAAGLAAGTLAAAVAVGAASPPDARQLSQHALAWTPDGGDARFAVSWAPEGTIETNGSSIRPPAPGADRARWLDAVRSLRREARAHPTPARLRVDYRGVRAWIRVGIDEGRRLALAPGESIAVTLEARWLAGNGRVGFAIDRMDAATSRWVGWSGVFASVDIPRDGAWHTLTASLTVPSFDARHEWANLIIGQDATFGPESGSWEVRAITLGCGRTAAREALAAGARAPGPLDRRLYSRPSMRWVTRDFTCYFAFLYDRSMYDTERRAYRTATFLSDLRRRFGRIDSVVLWQAYPRIGVDQRNQFDFYRDMPGGLAGLRRVVDHLHREGVRVFLAYNPWDTGTRREKVDDSRALASMVRALAADGIFLDTMVAAPSGLRGAVDAARPGVTFEPEGQPLVEELSVCGASWAQWLPTFPEPSILQLKWIEPRHMQHQVRRWDREHEGEIEAALFNGSGMLVWENIFGSWNGWQARDEALWHRASAAMRAFAFQLSSEGWDPCRTTARSGVYANLWRDPHADVYLLVNRTGATVRGPLLRASRRGARVIDLWGGAPASIDAAGLLRGTLGRYGAFAVVFDPIGSRQARVARAALEKAPRVASAYAAPPAPPALPPRPPPPVVAADARPAGTVYVPAGAVHLRIRHERRECGCYPDPGCSPERRAYFLSGTPFAETLTHDYGPVKVGPLWVDECLVTNGEYERFLRASGYRPREPRNFLKHWGGTRSPVALRDHPVVYVGLEDARAYARWAGKRLPTEEEWQFAAQGADGRRWPWGPEPDPARCNGESAGTTPVRAYPAGRSPWGCYDMAGNVWQWTESERDDGHTRFSILRGGSYFDAKGSIWYVHGGAQPLDSHTKFLLLYPGLDRCATIGFRCVRDAPAGAKPARAGTIQAPAESGATKG